MIAVSRPRDTDHLLADKISSQLAETNRPSLRRLSVAVAGGHVTLRGHVGSFHEKQLALQAYRVHGAFERLTDAVEVAAF